MTIVGFISARLDDDERIANESKRPDSWIRRLLREIAAKRRVLTRHSGHGLICDGCGNDYMSSESRYLLEECPELRDLAAPFATHPDYDESWKP